MLPCLGCEKFFDVTFAVLSLHLNLVLYATNFTETGIVPIKMDADAKMNKKRREKFLSFLLMRFKILRKASFK